MARTGEDLRADLWLGVESMRGVSSVQLATAFLRKAAKAGVIESLVPEATGGLYQAPAVAEYLTWAALELERKFEGAS